jgi:hypothetical protein
MVGYALRAYPPYWFWPRSISRPWPRVIKVFLVLFLQKKNFFLRDFKNAEGFN